MSRHALIDVTPNCRQEKVAEEFVNYLAETSTSKTINLNNLKLATQNDVTLQAVITAVQTGKWFDISKDPRVNTSKFQFLEKVKEEQCSLPDLVLRGHRIAAPETLGEKVVDIAHEGHMGMTKTKALVRKNVSFPKNDCMFEAKSCLACQVTTPRTEREALQMSELPSAPWTKVSIDFGVAPTGSSEYLIILIDDYSRFLVVKLVGSTSAEAVIPRLDKIFFSIRDT